MVIAYLKRFWPCNNGWMTFANWCLVAPLHVNQNIYSISNLYICYSNERKYISWVKRLAYKKTGSNGSPLLRSFCVLRTKRKIRGLQPKSLTFKKSEERAQEHKIENKCGQVFRMRSCALSCALLCPLRKNRNSWPATIYLNFNVKNVVL